VTSLGRRLASQSSVIFAARLFGAGLIFLAQAGIARLWGAGALGQYLVLVAAANLCAVLLPLGFQTIGVYFTAEYRARQDGRMLRRFLRTGYAHIAGMTLVLLMAGGWLTGHLGGPAQILAHHFWPYALMALATTLVFFNGAVLVGLKHPLAGYFADGLFRPLAVVGAFLIAVAWAGTDGFATMIWLVALAYVAIALVQTGYLLAKVVVLPETVAARPGEARRWWRFAVPWLIVGMATDFFFDIDLLLLAGHLSAQELAVFGVCTRVFSLVAFGVAAVYAVAMPDMFESEALADRAGFHRKIGDANLVASGLAVLLTIGVVLGAPLLLRVFGPDFAQGAWPLAILCLGLVVRSAMGPAAMVLSVHDRPYASLPAVALGLATLVAANWLLVPLLGLLGAALAALLAMSLWAVALWAIAWRRAGVDVSILPRLRAWRAQ